METRGNEPKQKWVRRDPRSKVKSSGILQRMKHAPAGYFQNFELQSIILHTTGAHQIWQIQISKFEIRNSGMNKDGS
jgi:hypothetical protein